MPDPHERSKWGKGPWDLEPEDHVGWFSHGLLCNARRNGYGAWCGYVAVDRGHPLFGTRAVARCTTPSPRLLRRVLRALDSIVHGGITYSGDWTEAVLPVSAPVAGDESACAHVVRLLITVGDLWWFGFDTNHYGDTSPRTDLLPGDPFQHGTYRTLAYTRDVTDRLAKVLASMY